MWVEMVTGMSAFFGHVLVWLAVGMGWIINEGLRLNKTWVLRA